MPPYDGVNGSQGVLARFGHPVFPNSTSRSLLEVLAGYRPAEELLVQLLVVQRDSKEVPVHCRFHISENGRIWSGRYCPAMDYMRAWECACIIHPSDS